MRIVHLYQSNSPVFSIEIFPPKTEKGCLKLKEKLAIFKEYRPDFISVTYGAGGGTRHNTHQLASYIKNQLKIEAMAHLTCVSHTKAEIAQVLKHLEAANIENIMALRGDFPEGPPLHQEENGFAYASELIEAIAEQGKFGIGGAGYPEGHPETSSIEEHFQHFLIKVKAGVDFIITQFFLDNQVFFKWRDQVRKRGVEVPLIAGVMPALSAEQIVRFANTCGCSVPSCLLEALKRHSTSPESMHQVGLDFAQKQIEGLLQAGVDGIHLYALNRLSTVQQLAPIIKNKVP